LKLPPPGCQPDLGICSWRCIDWPTRLADTIVGNVADKAERTNAGTALQMNQSVTDIARFRLLDLRTGRVQTFGPAGQPSGIAKTPAGGLVKVGKLGLDGDEQADKLHHGGIDKAVVGKLAGKSGESAEHRLISAQTSIRSATLADLEIPLC